MCPSRPGRRLLWSLALVAGVALLTGAPAPAGATPPASPGVAVDMLQAHVAPGTSVDVRATVTTRARTPDLDVVLLIDTASSMESLIDGVRTNLTVVVNGLRASYPTAQFAVASYGRDGEDADLFRVWQALTPTTANVNAAIAALPVAPYSYSCSYDPETHQGACDTAEDWVNGLYQVPRAISFRPGSNRVVVLVGTVQSHDPSDGHRLADANTALSSVSARVVAANLGTGGLDGTGQLTALFGTGTVPGRLLGVGTPADGLRAAIQDGLPAARVTVSHSVTGDWCRSMVFDRGDREVTSGGQVSYRETLPLAPGAPVGTALVCTVQFLVTGGTADVDTYSQTLTVYVDVAELGEAVDPPVERIVEPDPPPAPPPPAPPPPASPAPAAARPGAARLADCPGHPGYPAILGCSSFDDDEHSGAWDFCPGSLTGVAAAVVLWRRPLRGRRRR